MKKRYTSKVLSQEKAEIYGKELEKISKEKGLNPDNVVGCAEDKSNPLHEYFDWNDSSAGEKWRKQQARFLINSIEIEIIEGDCSNIGFHSDDSKVIAAFESISVTDNGDQGEHKREYLPILDILSDADRTRQLLDVALREEKYWKSKYKHLVELKPIFKGIEKVEENLKKKDGKRKTKGKSSTS